MYVASPLLFANIDAHPSTHATPQTVSDLAMEPDCSEMSDPVPFHLTPWREVQKRRRAEAERNKDPGAPKRKRRPFYASTKKAVCEMHAANPSLSRQQLADHFGVDRSMITRALQEEDVFLRSRHREDLQFARRRYFVRSVSTRLYANGQYVDFISSGRSIMRSSRG